MRYLTAIAFFAALMSDALMFGLQLGCQDNMNEQTASSDIAHAEYIGYGMGHGELDVVRALSAAQNGNYGEP